MKFLILNTDYSAFTEWLYGDHPGLAGATFAELLRLRNESLFAQADFFSHNLRQLGHQALEVHVNNERLQRAWGAEHGLRLPPPRPSLITRGLRRAGLLPPPESWQRTVLDAQLRHYEPDVILNHDPLALDCSWLSSTPARRASLRILQHAVMELPGDADYSCYGLALSSYPPTVQFFRNKGLRAELFLHGFETTVATQVAPRSAPLHDVTFVGNLFDLHSDRFAWLETICRNVPEIKVFAPSIDHLPDTSPIRERYHGAAWGRSMYEVVGASRISLNHHTDRTVFANNMRLYEATGMGTFLLTDWHPNLGELFEVGGEVVAYRGAEDCIDKIRYYLAHEDERLAIAAAGRIRTTRDHTYRQRMEQLVHIVEATA